jgi:hypothetical protein
MKSAAQLWRANFLIAEMGLAVLLTGLFVLWVEWWGGLSTVNDALADNRGQVYGVLASIFGALLGFAITTASIVLGFSSSDRLVIVRESRHYGTIWKVFFAAIRTTGLATVVALIGLIVDRDTEPTIAVMYVCFFATALASLRLMRCVWVLENVINLVTAPSKARWGAS